ncbi:unnamed protein product [Linum trigynum]|uniref:Uncharacterized protein n=1 Tax=Linum trigynum TaxID=586398 RepID=A0AAV2CG86_9ROSI
MPRPPPLVPRRRGGGASSSPNEKRTTSAAPPSAVSAKVLQGDRDGSSSASVILRRISVADDYDADEGCREEEEDPSELSPW